MATTPRNQDTTRGLANLNLALSNTLKTDLPSTAWPKGQRLRDHRVTGLLLAHWDLAHSRCRGGLARSFLGAGAHGISSSSAFSLQPKCCIQAPSPPSRSLKRERCPTETSREPALLQQPQGKEGIGGGRARPFLYCSSIYHNSAHCPSVLATASPCMPQHTHRTSKTTDAPAAPHVPRHEEGDGSSSRWRKHSPASSCGLLICAAHPAGLGPSAPPGQRCRSAARPGNPRHSCATAGVCFLQFP